MGGGGGLVSLGCWEEGYIGVEWEIYWKVTDVNENLTHERIKGRV